MERFADIRRLAIGVTAGLGVMALAGCAGVKLPLYLQEKHPDVRRFYAEYDPALQAVLTALGQTGWTVEKTASPAAYEVSRKNAPGGDQLLIFSRIRKFPGFQGGRSARLNLYLRTKQGVSEIEIRCAASRRILFWNFKVYRDDRRVEEIFVKIKELLLTSSQAMDPGSPLIQGVP